MRNLDYLDYRIAIMTGTSGGVTGGDIIPDGMIGVIRDIQYSEVTQTGQTIRLRMQPSGSDIDIKRLAANQNFPSDWADNMEDSMLGIIGQNNVLQAVTSLGNVIVKVTYTVEEGRQAAPTT